MLEVRQRLQSSSIPRSYASIYAQHVYTYMYPQLPPAVHAETKNRFDTWHQTFLNVHGLEPVDVHPAFLETLVRGVRDNSVWREHSVRRIGKLGILTCGSAAYRCFYVFSEPGR